MLKILTLESVCGSPQAHAHLQHVRDYTTVQIHLVPQFAYPSFQRLAIQ
jgi:hypothetical protein